MKKIYFTFVLICLSVVCYSQVKSHSVLELQFNGVQKYHIDSLYYEIPVFSGADFNFFPGNNSLSISKYFHVSDDVNVNSFTISSIEYENLQLSDLGQISLQYIPTSQDVKYNFVKARNDKKVVVSAYPIINENGVLKRLKVLNFSYSNSNSSNARSVASIPIVSNSVLATGDFFRFQIEKTGVYKILKSQIQQLLGVSNSIDPRKIKIFGSGGTMLPLSNSNEVPFDLVENAIEVIGENDGVLDNEDFVLFYAIAGDQWDDAQYTGVNLYDTKTFYYISISGGNGKRIQTNPIDNSPANTVISTYNQIDFYEKNLVNIGRLGRKWLGENFNITSSRDFSFNIPNLKLDENILLEVSAAAAASSQTSFSVRANNTAIGSMNFNPIMSSIHVSGYDNMVRSNFVSSSASININVVYNNSGVPSSNGYLDYIKLTSINNLRGYGKQFKFYNTDAAAVLGIGKYQFQNSNAITQVLDISNPYNITSYKNNESANFNFNVNLGEVRKYVAVDRNDYYTIPSQSGVRIPNQNLKGTIFKNEAGQFQDIDYLIIATKEYMNEANRLAELHRSINNYNVKVVDVNLIYNEFSSGQKDIAAIRNFIRYVYFNASTPDKAVKYINLFGDTTYDYKNVVPNNINIIPTFHFLAITNPSSIGDSSNYSNYITFMSDDFYGLMDDNEGTLTSNFQMGIDIAVGRMIFSNISQARDMVDKVYKYYDKSSYGRWKNNVILLSDDIDASSDINLQSDLDQIGQNIEINRPYVNLKKIYMDAYQQTTSAGGNRYVDAKQDFISSFDAGALLINYYGHGGERVLASERIFELNDVEVLKNNYKLPVFVTITCEVSRFDNPYLQSLGESIYLNPKAGAIAMLTTTREIGITNGRDINAAISNLIFNNSNEDKAIGEILRLAKNNFSMRDRNVVFCIGDPALKILFPKPKVVLSKVNNMPIDGNEDQLQALSYVTLEGEVLDENNTVIPNFNGDLAVQIYDKNIDRQTLGNDNVTNNLNVVHKMNFVTLGETIFRGNASVTNGKFQIGFVVPKDIKIPLGNGRISFYAKNTDGTIDKTGYNSAIRVGGINNNAPVDNTPPVVKLYMNDTSFISGGITNNAPIFLAFLEDENGINTASGIGHDIIAILDGDEMNPYILNDFYETELDDYKNGRVRFPFQNLLPGLHTITFKAWDVYNNPIVSEIQFIVTEGDGITLKNVLNYPNPFVNYTEFWFTHNRPFETLNVQVQIMTISGKVVKTINETILTEGFLSRSIKWDGLDDFGSKLGKGVFIYKLTVQSVLTNKKTEKIEKLVLL